MVIKRSSFRVNDESYNMLLNYRLDENRRAKQRRCSDAYEGYSSAEFLQEEIQPKIMRVDGFFLCSDGIDRSKPLPKMRPSPHHIPGCIRQQTIQPSKAIMCQENETKKRPRSSHGKPEATINTGTTSELRIGGGTTSDIVKEIRTNLSIRNEESSVVFKGIRKLPTNFSNLDKNENEEEEEALCLLSSLKDLVQNKGSSWKKIRMQKCSPSLMELILASPHCHHLEEIHISDMCDDDEDELKEQETEALAGPKHQTLTSSLIISLLTKAMRIKALVLKNCNLDNFDLVRIMNILCSHPNHPTSLERLDLRFNEFTPTAIHSILIDHVRSSLHSLKELKVRQGIRCLVQQKIRNAVLQSLRCNRVVLESIDVFDSDRSVQYLLDINRAKRRFIFCNNDRFPRTLWPLLLEQALVVNEDDGRDLLIRKVSSPPVPSTRYRYDASAKRQASVLYHIFRNGGPMLLEQQHSTKQLSSFESNQ